MAFCQQCGTELKGDGGFCGSCGAATGATAAAQAPQAAAPTPWQPQGPAGGPVPEAKGTRGLGLALQWLFGIGAALSLITSVVALSFLGSVQDIESGRLSGFDALLKAEDIEAALAAVGGVTFVIGIPIFVLLIIWTHRGYKNLQSFGVKNYRLSLGMAIGAWFIPFYNLGGPKQIINDVWRGSELGRPIDHAWTKRSILAISTMWWVGYFVFGLATAVGNGMVTGGGNDPFLGSKIIRDPAEAATGLMIQAVGFLGLAAVLVLGLLTIRKITARHMAKISEVQEARRVEVAEASQPDVSSETAPIARHEPDLPTLENEPPDKITNERSSFETGEPQDGL
ncbi:MAG: DUF4328 domain-containing protein [Acidimicrobiales bacterium]